MREKGNIQTPHTHTHKRLPTISTPQAHFQSILAPSTMFTKSLLLLLLALSITALSLPSAKEDLEKRWSNPWIGSFPSDDGSCDNKNLQGSRPEWTRACVAFQATTDRVGMFQNPPLSPNRSTPAFDVHSGPKTDLDSQGEVGVQARSRRPV